MRTGEAQATWLSQYLAVPHVAPPLDPGFRPAILCRPQQARAVVESGVSVPVVLAVQQPGGSVAMRETAVLRDHHPRAPASYALCARLIKTILWSRGGSRIWIDGPAGLVVALQRHYDQDPVGRFDSRTVGQDVFGAPIEVVAAPRSGFPVDRAATLPLGGHLEGCRIGFDLGASDRKAAAVLDGQVVFSEEIAWDPAHHDDPQWHFDEIMDSLRRAAAHLPRVDAIGGSAAGIYIEGEVRVASLFRAVRPELHSRLSTLFREVAGAWGGVPFVVVNDGEVTALAGAMAAGVGGLLGIAMGSSEAAGYVTPAGGLTPWLNELAFVPIDYRLDAPIDEWSGDRGCGVQYLSQQAVGRLLPVAGIDVDQQTPLPEQLVLLQQLVDAGDRRAARVYETIGTYLGYALLEYRDWYEFEHVLVLGRVTSGPGGEVITAQARRVLDVEAPAASASITFHAASERDKRHGQAVAAASLPALSSNVREQPWSEPRSSSRSG